MFFRKVVVMNRLFVSLILSIVFPAFICTADVAPETPKAPLPTGLINKNPVPSVPNVINLGKIKIDHIQKKRIVIPLENIEEAAAVKGPIAEAVTPLSVGNRYLEKERPNLLSTISPDHRIHYGFLSLSKIHNDKNTRAITFVFLMNKDKNAPKDSPRMRMHIMGSPKIFKEQRIVQNELPLDVTMAKYDDGYAPREWNMVLPNKKPREVKVELLWSF
jgi:hypothetical protein